MVLPLPGHFDALSPGKCLSRMNCTIFALKYT